MSPSAQPITQDPGRLLAVDEVAQLLGMSEAWVRQHANRSRRPNIPSVKLGKCRRFRWQDVMLFIEASMETAAQ